MMHSHPEVDVTKGSDAASIGYQKRPKRLQDIEMARSHRV
jgi:hypothetical protein